MTVQMVRFTTSEGDVADVEAGIDTLLAAVDRVQPAGMRYAALRLADGVSFVLLLELDDGVDNPLRSIPEARTFQQQMATWATTAPTPEAVAVVGSYRLFGSPDRAGRA